MAERRIAVVGAGMAGMAAAYELARRLGVALTLFEASPRLGGTVETVTVPSASGEPFVIECGPDSWVSERPAARELAVELGLALVYSNDARRRTYLARGRALLPMPEGMRMIVPTRWAPILESPLFSWQARLAYLREPRRAEELKQHALATDADESVASFTRRHFGEEATRTIAGPLLAGVFGGDIEQLSARAVLAPFVRMEREHGSLITAVMQRAALERAAPDLPLFTTLADGLEALIDRMAAALAPTSIRLGTAVTSLRRHAQGWTLGTQAHGEAPREQTFDAILLATPAHVTRALLQPIHPAAADLLQMDATSAIVVALAFERSRASALRIPRGFGFLVPGGNHSPAAEAGPTLLAGTFLDQKFPGRAPQGAVLLRGFFGGEQAPAMLDWTDERIAEAARAHFARLVGPLPSPDHIVVRRWPRSLPQYTVGHVERMARLEGLLNAFPAADPAAFPGADPAERPGTLPAIRLTGNAYHGVGLPSLVEHGRSAARALAGLA